MAGPNGSRGSVLTPNPIAAAPGGERDKALASVMAQIEKQHGKGAVMRLGDDVRPPIEVIPTGSIALDVALGIGGLPRGRVVEIYGPESSGKTTVALHAVANAQKAGGIAAFIDAEHALDPDYAKALGVDTDALLVSQPDTGEQALEIADMLIRSGALDIIVIDSVAALVPRAEIEGEMGDSHVGLQARLMSQALRKITGALSTTGTTAIFINQLREKIGVMFGSPETTTGGKALKFYASVRLDVRRIETLKDGTDAVGNRTRCKVVKNKVSPAVQAGRVRHHLRPGHLPRGRPDRHGGGAGLRAQGRRLVHHGRRPARAGQGERPRVPQGQPRPRRRAREEHQGQARHRGSAPRDRGRARDLGRVLSPPGLIRMSFADSSTPPPAWAVGSTAVGSTAVGSTSSPPPPDPEADPRTRGHEPDPHDWARQIVLRQLTAAPRSRSQLEQALRRKECPDDVAAAVLDRMEEVGLVDDTAYAGMLVRSQQAGRGLARRALAQELRRKGVDDETAQAALDEVDPHDEEDRARELVAKKMRSMSGLEPVVQTRRLAGMLARKGYPSELTMRIVREAVREAPEHQRD